MNKIEKYALAFMLLWAIFVLFLNGPLVYREIPYDEGQAAMSKVEYVLHEKFENKDATVNLKTIDVQRIVEVGNVYTMSYLIQLTTHVITASIMLVITGFILIRPVS